MTAELRDVTGSEGERIVASLLTNYEASPEPLFRPAFLGDKWPTIDFYVEFWNLSRKRPYFFVQAKTTSTDLMEKRRLLRISSKKQDVARLLAHPGPTYIFGVHEPSRRVFIRSVHRGTPVRAFTQIPFSNELTSNNLKMLYDEVERFWNSASYKPQSSVFE
jgi:hypothetical protein